MAAGSKLLIVGDGPLKPCLEPFYDSEYNITWLGYVADEDHSIEILRGAMYLFCHRW